MSPGPTPNPKYFAIVAAAGVGARIGHDTPKQYLPLAGRCALEWSVAALLEARWFDQVVVAVAPGDERAHAVLGAAMRGDARLSIARLGGATRRDTVLAAIDSLASASTADFVLVHDAARPGLHPRALDRLRSELGEDPIGGLLALAVDDTVKQSGPGGEVNRTIARDGLWLAQTPQMFRYGVLRRALANHPQVTDEAAAIEAQGLAVRLVRGERSNFKVTTAEDLAMMDALLRGRREG